VRPLSPQRRRLFWCDHLAQHAHRRGLEHVQHDRQLLAHLPDRIQETEHQHQHDKHQLEFTSGHFPHVPQPQAFETEDGRYRRTHGDDVPHQQVRQQAAH
jgi:hypothetical protein